ncbi:MAG: ThuA domain-containing protein [Thermomicrobiales bacterium]|nr:ThuA domain-containing protein [Thermomicrobiales bacterium]
MGSPINVLIWNEYRQEREEERIAKVYPNGIHAQLANLLGEDGDVTVRTATLDEPEHGLTDDALAATDVLVWWGHMHHDEVADEVVERVRRRVLDGMGLIVLHSAHFSKLFKALMGTTCNLKWRADGEKERLWVVDPTHPIVEGIGEYIELPEEEMYGEHFDVPAPEALVFVSWFAGGEVFRSGACYSRGAGKIFYFRPGHERHPTYYDPAIGRVIRNAVRWAAPVARPQRTFDLVPALEPIEAR